MTGTWNGIGDFQKITAAKINVRDEFPSGEMLRGGDTICIPVVIILEESS